MKKLIKDNNLKNVFKEKGEQQMNFREYYDRQIGDFRLMSKLYFKKYGHINPFIKQYIDDCAIRKAEIDLDGYREIIEKLRR